VIGILEICKELWLKMSIVQVTSFVNERSIMVPQLRLVPSLTFPHFTPAICSSTHARDPPVPLTISTVHTQLIATPPSVSQTLDYFYPRNGHYASAGTSCDPASAVSVCLSVCLSPFGVLSKRRTNRAGFWHGRYSLVNVLTSNSAFFIFAFLVV